MIAALIVLQIVSLLAILCLLVRRPPTSAPDPQLSQLPDQLSRLIAEEATRTRRESAESSAELRKEVISNITTLGNTLKEGLDSFREDNRTSGNQLSEAVKTQLDSIAQRLTAFTTETNQQHTALREALYTKLAELMNSNAVHQEKLRTGVEQSLATLNKDNATKLEEMRATVDEKLQSTLNERLTQSFGQVTTHLGEVQKGLGEMKELATGVGDLKKIFSNVSRRGGVGEAILGQLIGQILAPVQYREKVNLNPATREVVEYAVRLPSATGEMLLPIDSKFPSEDWARLQAALDAGVTKDITTAGKAFDAAIRIQAKRISETYINEPITTPHAIMFLPSESLYAEVIRRDGLQEDVQRNYHITIAGPSTLSAILISFKMGFQLLNLQQKGNDVWRVLAATRTEFNKFGKLIDSVEKQVGTVQNTIHSLGVRTRAINRTLGDVSEADASQENVLSFEGVAPQLAASVDED